jgi:hypothetical protein
VHGRIHAFATQPGEQTHGSMHSKSPRTVQIAQCALSIVNFWLSCYCGVKGAKECSYSLKRFLHVTRGRWVSPGRYTCSCFYHTRSRSDEKKLRELDKTLSPWRQSSTWSVCIRGRISRGSGEDRLRLDRCPVVTRKGIDMRHFTAENHKIGIVKNGDTAPGPH